MLIAYLAPQFTESDDFTFEGDEERKELVLSHPETVKYSPLDFQVAFNESEISDLGYIYIIND